MYKVYFMTFGCKVNHYETDCMKQLFREKGFYVTDAPEGADAVVINSCTVTSSGDSRTLTALRKMRESLPEAVIVLTGCYPQASPDEASGLESADIVTGTKNRKALPDMVLSFIADHSRRVELSSYSAEDRFEPLVCSRFDDSTRAFVKIQDGCDRFCSYCLIPFARGRLRSKPLELLRKEAAEIAAGGIKEIVLCGINLAFYRDGDADMADAARVCSETEGIVRVRLGSLEPEMMTDDMLARLASIEGFCPQFHLSLQSGCTRVLKAMNRRYTADEYLALTERIRRFFPDCSFTTDIMVGFPGETDDDHRESVGFIARVGFSKVHVFRYSRRKGTVADRMPGQVAESVKTLRWNEMNKAAEESRRKYLESLVGKTVPVLFERENSPDFHQGHAPDHTLIKISRKNHKKSLRNQIISVIIEEYSHDHCFGRPVCDTDYDID